MANESLVIHAPGTTLDQKVMALILCTVQEKRAEIERAQIECEGRKIEWSKQRSKRTKPPPSEAPSESSIAHE